MSKFYFLLWLQWALRVTLSSVSLGAVSSLLMTLFIYVKQGSAPIDGEVLQALGDIFLFWFPLFWSVTLLIALFRSLKYIFNICHNGYELKLLECNQTDIIDVIGYGDLVKVWRRWFMLLIWLSGVQMIIAYALTYLFSDFTSIFDWFNIYVLFTFILISGYFSFILLANRCKKVKVVKC